MHENCTLCVIKSAAAPYGILFMKEGASKIPWFPWRALKSKCVQVGLKQGTALWETVEGKRSPFCKNSKYVFTSVVRHGFPPPYFSVIKEAKHAWTNSHRKQTTTAAGTDKAQSYLAKLFATLGDEMSWRLITAKALFTGLHKGGMTCLWQPWLSRVTFFTQHLAKPTKLSSGAVGVPCRDGVSASRSSVLSILSLL